MSFVARFERTLEGFVNTTFARIFRSEVKPVELRSALERELDNTAQVLSRDSALAPNTFVVELSPSDHSRLAGYGETLSGDLAKAVEEHAQVENYTLPGRVQIDLRPADDLSTGRFRVTSKPVSAGPRPPAPKPPVTARPTPSASWGPTPTPPACDAADAGPLNAADALRSDRRPAAHALARGQRRQARAGTPGHPDRARQRSRPAGHRPGRLPPSRRDPRRLHRPPLHRDAARPGLDQRHSRRRNPRQFQHPRRRLRGDRREHRPDDPHPVAGAELSACPN